MSHAMRPADDHVRRHLRGGRLWAKALGRRSQDPKHHIKKEHKITSRLEITREHTRARQNEISRDHGDYQIICDHQTSREEYVLSKWDKALVQKSQDPKLHIKRKHKITRQPEITREHKIARQHEISRQHRITR